MNMRLIDKYAIHPVLQHESTLYPLSIMKVTIPILSLFLLSLSCACKQSDFPEPLALTDADLIGNWEVYEYGHVGKEMTAGEPSFFMGLYCSAFVLRENHEFAIYYWRSGPAEDSRVDGTWSINNDSDLILIYGTSLEIKTRITSFDSQDMLLEHEWAIGDTTLNEAFRLRKK